MTRTEQMLAEQQVRAYQARLKHIDELIARARTEAEAHPEDTALRDRLARFTSERDSLAALVERLRLDPTGDWRVQEIEKAGPMGIWDAVAQQLENLTERLERRDR